ncbi:hypothetical protein FB451DRAFT_1237060, partial [Mycena latifolia]
MYPDGRTNPTPAHFARNTPVECHLPVSSRLLHQRHLDREGRAICRIVYAHGLGVQRIANVFCVSEDTIIQALQNNSAHEQHDTEEHDYFYVSEEYRNQYPPPPKVAAQRPSGYIKQASDFEAFQGSILSSPTQSKGNDGKAHRDGQPQAHPAKNNGRSSAITFDIKKVQPSDGAGINPTCRHFKDNIPVLTGSRGTDASNSRLVVLDRKGRAICRIMHPYLGSYTKIAVIFGITHTRVRKAVLNEYAPPDDVAEDYEHAGQEFKDQYPPFPGKRAPPSFGKRQMSPELDDIPRKRARKDESATQPAPKAVRMMPVVELPSRTTAKADPGAVGIRSFLKNVGGFDLSKWQETFKAKGLCTMGDLATLASLEEGRLVRTLTRLFADEDQKMVEVHILLLADALLDLAKDV